MCWAVRITLKTKNGYSSANYVAFVTFLPVFDKWNEMLKNINQNRSRRNKIDYDHEVMIATLMSLINKNKKTTI